MPRGHGRRNRPPDQGSRYEPLGQRGTGRQRDAGPGQPPAAEPAERDGPPKRAGVCWLFNSQEGCRFGDTCKFEHVLSEACLDFARGKPCSRTPCRFRHVELCTAAGCSGKECQLAHVQRSPPDAKPALPFFFGSAPAPWAPKAAAGEADWDPLLRLAILEADEAIVRAGIEAEQLRCLGREADGFPLPPGGPDLPGAVGCPDCGEVLSLRGQLQEHRRRHAAQALPRELAARERFGAQVSGMHRKLGEELLAALVAVHAEARQCRPLPPPPPLVSEVSVHRSREPDGIDELKRRSPSLASMLSGAPSMVSAPPKPPPPLVKAHASLPRSPEPTSLPSPCLVPSSPVSAPASPKAPPCPAESPATGPRRCASLPPSPSSPLQGDDAGIRKRGRVTVVSPSVAPARGRARGFDLVLPLHGPTPSPGLGRRASPLPSPSTPLQLWGEDAGFRKRGRASVVSPSVAPPRGRARGLGPDDVLAFAGPVFSSDGSIPSDSPPSSPASSCPPSPDSTPPSTPRPGQGEKRGRATVQTPISAAPPLKQGRVLAVMAPDPAGQGRD